MAKYHHSPIAELTHQLKLSPVRLRLKQHAAVEYLVDLIQPEKSYPYDFICHQITGYRPKTDGVHKTMLGKTLVSDLVQLAEELSVGHPLPIEGLPGSYWTTEELARRLKVSSKTICRWRHRGLAGWRLRFPDATVRMAFSEASVRRFVVKHFDLVRRGASFSQLGVAEKRQIIDMAREILAERRRKLHEVSQIIAARVGRAVETVRYTLRRHDEAHPAEALFRRDHQPVVQPELQAVYDAVVAEGDIRQVASRFKRSADSVREIVREVRARKLLARLIHYMYNPEFAAPDAEQKILAELEPAGDRPAGGKPKRAPADLPPYLQELYRHPLLSPEQERHLFRQYNYLKYLADRARKNLDPLAANDEQLARIEGLVAQADRVRNAILQANLRLVVSIARRHVGRSAQFFEIVSDGNLALMRAVEKFDYARGYKFSTYASWAVMRNYARTIPEQMYESARLVTGRDELLATVASDNTEAIHDSFVESIRHLLQKGLALLSARERDIVVRHYGLNNGGQAMTLDQIGKSFGVTKERIRQIERKAIRKLQAELEPGQFGLGTS